MHELSIAESLIDCVCEGAGDARVLRVVVEIGKLSAVVPEAVRACFDLCARGTSVEGAALEIDEIEGCARCRACGAEVAVADLFGVCPCGSHELAVVRGEELRLREVELEVG
jgi:hydrogenase nickel incorporation protein HypA/HybF